MSVKSIVQKPVVFSNQGLDIYGILHLPGAAGRPALKKIPAVIFCHGFTGTKIEPHQLFVKAARDLAAHGIATLRFDFRFTGDSEGDFQNMTISTEIADTVRAIDWLSEQGQKEGIDTGKIGLLGLSLGGLVAVCTAVRDKRVKALALWAPVSDLSASDTRVRVQRKEKIRNISGGDIDYGGNWVGKAFFAEISKFRPLEEIKRFKGPVLIIHGTGDDLEPHTNAQAYSQAVPSAKVLLIDGANHTFNSLAWEHEVITATTTFFLDLIR